MSARVMPDSKERIQKAVYDAIDALNEQLADGQKLAKKLETVLMGSGGKLDSVGFINLVVLLEEKCEERCGVSLSIADSSQSVEPNPFQTIESLVDYLDRVLEKKLSGQI